MSYLQRAASMSARIAKNSLAVVGVATTGTALYGYKKWKDFVYEIENTPVTITWPNQDPSKATTIEHVDTLIGLYDKFKDSNFETTVKLVPKDSKKPDIVICKQVIEFLSHEYHLDDNIDAACLNNDIEFKHYLEACA